jgi:hypothetical protein
MMLQSLAIAFYGGVFPDLPGYFSVSRYVVGEEEASELMVAAIKLSVSRFLNV